MKGTEGAIRKVAIVGSGVEGWLTALALTRSLGASVAVTVVEAPGADDGLGLALAALPGFAAFNTALGVDEDDLLRAARGSFSLGVRHQGWNGAASAYFEPFGDVGASFGPVAFHNFLLRLGEAQALERYSVAALAARQGRFARPSQDPRSVLSTFAYGITLDTSLYAEHLRRVAVSAGAEVTDGRFVEAVRGEDGGVTAVTLSSGERVEADLFLDASGPTAVLMSALGVDYEDWGHWAPFDRINERIVPEDAALPFRAVDVEADGWSIRTPLQGAETQTFVYSSAHTTDADAAARLDHAGPGRSAPHLRRFIFGRRRHFWSNNCIAIGAAACALGPLEGGELHLLQTGVSTLLSLFPRRVGDIATAREYDRLVGAAVEDMRDLTLLHYRLNTRVGDAVWDATRDAEPPESLAYKLRLFESRARLAPMDGDAFPASTWVSVMLGQGVRPRRYDPLADADARPQTETMLHRINAAMSQAVAGLPPLPDYIRSRCAAPTIAVSQ
jgi:tryptophan halogenase